MSRKSKGVTLPHTLQRELGLELRRSGGRGRTSVGNRKQLRKTGRIEKKAAKAGRSQRTQREPLRPVDDEEEDGGSSNRDEDPHTIVAQAAQLSSAARNERQIAEPKIKSILKRPVLHGDSDESNETSSSRGSSPGLVLVPTSRAFKDRAARDDAEISALEKKLGLKNKKARKSFGDGGFDDLLEGFDSEDESPNNKRDTADWLANKRRKLIQDEDSSQEAEDPLEDSEAERVSESDIDDSRFDDTEEFPATEDEDEDDFAGFESDMLKDSDRPPASIKKVRENPYVAPVTLTTPVGKYIPPSLRKRTGDDTEALTRLQRQIQGHLNKLSEANLISILREVEHLYQNHPRQDVTSTLTDLLLSLFCDRSTLQSTFVILHATFISAVYKVIGTDFGAEVVSKWVDRFDHFYSETPQATSKQAVNLISLLSHLYIFHVINSTLLFDYIRICLQNLSESNTELLLRVVKDCGPQLRQDDPSSLKSIVQLMQNATARFAADGKEMSVRTKFMMETITDLKNNKMKASTSSSGIVGEHIKQMRKVLGLLNNRTLRASEPLRISLNDIKDSDQKGKWWLVGASWKGNESVENKATPIYDKLSNDEDVGTGDTGPDLSVLARQHGMNTAIRRSIFVAIMSGLDWQDAQVRLTKLHLNQSQNQEIPHVLIRCACAEAQYNPYYTLIAKRLCSSKRMKMSFQFVLWNLFKRMGEKGDAEDDDDGETEVAVELPEIIVLGKLYGNLIADGDLTLGVLRILNLAYLKEQAKMFLELLLIVVITRCSRPLTKEGASRSISSVFSRTADTPGLVRGLQHFIKSIVRQSDLPSAKEARIVKDGCKVALKALSAVAASQAGLAS